MRKLRHLIDEPSEAGSRGWVKLQRSAQAEELLLIYPNAFLLLTQIAFRARRTTSNIMGLAPGEAFIGDYKNAGIATERMYRTSKYVLSKLGFATFKATCKGTIAKLVGTSIFDVNIETSDGVTDGLATGYRRASDGLATANKELKNEKNERIKEEDKDKDIEEQLPEQHPLRNEKKERIKDKDKYSRRLSSLQAFEDFWTAYPRKIAKGDAEKAWAKIKPDHNLIDRMVKALAWQRVQDQWTKNNGQYIPYPATWLNKRQWEDEPPNVPLPIDRPGPNETQAQFDARRESMQWESGK